MKVYDVNKMSSDIFIDNLKTEEGKNIALAYFELRVISKEMIKKFELGKFFLIFSSINNSIFSFFTSKLVI